MIIEKKTQGKTKDEINPLQPVMPSLKKKARCDRFWERRVNAVINIYSHTHDPVIYNFLQFSIQCKKKKL